MIHVNDIKTGITFLYENNLYSVLEFLHVKPGKGPAFVRAKLKNLRTGAIIDKTFNTNIKFEKAVIDKSTMQYLYKSGNDYYFMNNETYEQLELTAEQVGLNSRFLKEGLNVEIIFFKSELLGLNLPDKVELEIVDTMDAVKGNTTSNAQKDAELETGYKIKVPLFINKNEKILVSTKDGKYYSRA